MAGAATIVEREFLRGQRRWQTFAFRGGFALAMFVLFAMQYRDITRWQDWGAPADFASMGEGLFKWAMYTQWWIILWRHHSTPMLSLHCLRRVHVKATTIL